MTTVRDSIVDYATTALTTALDTITDDPLVEVEPDGDPDRFPSFAIFDNGHRVIEREASITRHRMQFTVEGYVTGGGGTNARTARNELHAIAVAALMEDDTFDGVIEQIEATDLRMATAVLASERRLMFAQDFDVEFTTQRTDPALPA